MRWLIALVATEGITEILFHSELLDKPRNFLKRFWFFEKILNCGWCLSFWVAIFVFGLIMLKAEIALVPIVIHRASNYVHCFYGILKNLRWRK